MSGYGTSGGTKQVFSFPSLLPRSCFLPSSSPQADDADMVPFIRINKGSVKEAGKMYASCLSWRASMLPVQKESCAQVLSRGMFFFHGEDKEGRPLGYLTMRGHDPKTRDLDECLRAIVYQCEALIASKKGKEFQVGREGGREGGESVRGRGGRARGSKGRAH